MRPCAQVREEMLDAGEDPQVILEAGREAMTLVGQRLRRRSISCASELSAGELLQAIGDGEAPAEAARLRRRRQGRRGKVVLGTVAGDIHDIGKDVVSFMLDVNNFEVLDLGVDVAVGSSSQDRQFKPDVVGMSGFLTMASTKCGARSTRSKRPGFATGQDHDRWRCDGRLAPPSTWGRRLRRRRLVGGEAREELDGLSDGEGGDHVSEIIAGTLPRNVTRILAAPRLQAV